MVTNMETKEGVWLIGVLVNDTWMCEGVFYDEANAAENCKYDEFLIFVKPNERLPENVKDALCMYWPKQETKETGMARLTAYKETQI